MKSWALPFCSCIAVLCVLSCGCASFPPAPQVSNQQSILRLVEWSAEGKPAKLPDFASAEHKIGDMAVRVTPLVIITIRDFADVSSYFAGTPLAKADAFMYAGTPTAGIPMITRPLTLFYVYCGKVDPQVTLQAKKATLVTSLSDELAAIQSEKIYMSAPQWEFPLWHQQHDAIFGFLVFPYLDDRCAQISLKLPYLYKDKQGTLVYKFGRTVLQKEVPRKTIPPR